MLRVQCKPLEPKIGPIVQGLWQALPDLLHLNTVLICVSLLLALKRNALFGGKAGGWRGRGDGEMVHQYCTYFDEGEDAPHPSKAQKQNNVASQAIVRPMQAYPHQLHAYIPQSDAALLTCAIASHCTNS